VGIGAGHTHAESMSTDGDGYSPIRNHRHRKAGLGRTGSQQLRVVARFGQSGAARSVVDGYTATT
jgi:hypothetical protein